MKIFDYFIAQRQKKIVLKRSSWTKKKKKFSLIHTCDWIFEWKFEKTSQESRYYLQLQVQFDSGLTKCMMKKKFFEKFGTPERNTRTHLEFTCLHVSQRNSFGSRVYERMLRGMRFWPEISQPAYTYIPIYYTGKKRPDKIRRHDSKKIIIIDRPS